MFTAQVIEPLSRNMLLRPSWQTTRNEWTHVGARISTCLVARNILFARFNWQMIKLLCARRCEKFPCGTESLMLRVAEARRSIKTAQVSMYIAKLQKIIPWIASDVWEWCSCWMMVTRTWKLTLMLSECCNHLDNVTCERQGRDCHFYWACGSALAYWITE